MEFETLKRSHLKRNILIAVVVVLVISAIILQFTRARYRVTESIPLVNGTINYTLPDLNIMALYINGEAAEELDSSKNYTLDTSRSTCTYKDGSTISNLSLSYDSSTKTFTISPYTTKGTKCTLYFNEVTSATDTIEGLYEDNQDILAYDGTTDNNLRYIGSDPSNYVYFNCSDYASPSSSTCELWRIIGVMNNMETADGNQSLVKLIRNDTLGNYSWDNKPSGIGSSTYVNGSNDWSDARLMMLLNPGYEEPNGDIYAYEGSLYYNARSGTCYSGTQGTTVSCDFTTTGLKNDTTRNMIETVTWKLGGIGDASATAATFYTVERGTDVYDSRPTEWEGKIALIYPSDYGYATSGGSTGRDTCLSYNLYDWDDYNDCYNNDWLYDSSTYQWTLTSRSSYSYSAFLVHDSGHVHYYRVRSLYGVRPSLYLTPDVSITGGTGTESDPYTLS